MTDLPTRLEVFQKYFSQLCDPKLPRKSLLLLMLTQAEAIVRAIKIELGQLNAEPVYKPIEKEHTEKYVFKTKVCCGREFNTPQKWAGHQNSGKHRNQKNNGKTT